MIRFKPWFFFFFFFGRGGGGGTIKVALTSNREGQCREVDTGERCKPHRGLIQYKAFLFTTW